MTICEKHGCELENNDGDIHMIWAQYDNFLIYRMLSKRYIPGIGWSMPNSVSPNSMSPFSHSRFAVNDAGKAVITWEEVIGMNPYDMNYYIWCNFYIPGRGWDNAIQLSANSVKATNPRAVIDSKGNAIVVWE